MQKKVYGSGWFVRSGDKTNLIGSMCEECESFWFPKRKICPSCFGENLIDKKFTNTGRVYSYSKLHIAAKGFEAPLSIGYIDFPEGVRVCGQIEGDIEIDSLVETSYGKIRTDPDGVPVYSYKFKAFS